MTVPPFARTVREWGRGYRQKVINAAPLPLLTHAHETFIALAMVLIGLGLLVGDVTPGSVHDNVPRWIADGWAWSLFVGAVLTLWGLFYDRPRQEWSGQLLLGWGCFFYTIALLLTNDLSQTGVVCGIFGGLTVVSWWRAFKVTSAPLVQLRLAQAARAAHRRAVEGGGRR